MKGTVVKKSFLYAFKIVNWLLRLIYLALAVAIIFLAAYYFGHELLFSLRGGDAASNLSIIHWFDNWFPRVPLWYPLQGGGVSLLYGYHFLSHLAAVILSRLTSIALENSYQVLGFLSVPLTSLGIYFFVWTRLKNQTTALVASFFYFLSPISWVWLFDWGFFGESVSYLFIPPALIFFDLFLCSVLARKFDFKSRLWFLLAVIFLVLLWITHALSFLGIIFFFPFYGLFYAFLSSKGKRIKNAAVSILVVFIFLAFTYLLASFHEINFQYYSLQAGTAGSASKEFFFKDASEWYFKPFLNLEEIPVENRRFAERNVSFAVPIWSLALLGLITSFWYSKKVFVIGVFSALNFLFVFYPAPVWRILNLTGAQHYRPLIISLRIFLPILAAFGVAAIPRLFWSVVFWWRRFLGKNISKVFHLIQLTLISVSTLALSVFVIIFFRYYSSQEPPAVRYGPYTLDFEMIDDSDWPYACPSEQNPFLPNICRLAKKPSVQKARLSGLCETWMAEGKSLIIPEFCAEGPPESGLNVLAQECMSGRVKQNYRVFCDAVVFPLTKVADIKTWPKFRLEADASIYQSGLATELLELKEEDATRIDVSPNLGGVTQSFNMNNFADSMLNLWGYQSSLNHSYWGYQQNVFYGKSEKTPVSLYNVAKWYGTQYVLLNTMDPSENFQRDPDNWEMVRPGIFHFKPTLKLYSYSTTKPLVLLIGSNKLAAYEIFFKLANEGVLSYDEAFLVLGKENIDDYSLKELNIFDALVLYGYSYKRQNKAFKLLDEYIEKGGSLYLSTGWQFYDRDWKIEKAPDFFPITSLTWSSDLETSSEFKIEDLSYADIDASKFGQLAWSGKSWGVSLPSEIRPWAKTVLSVSGYPIVVKGDYGEGKVVWSGLNWMGHISTYDNNPEEIKFLNAVFGFLLPSEDIDEESAGRSIIMTRDYPDKIEFTFSESLSPGALYFRESYHPDWKATIISGNRRTKLPIYKSGPLYKIVKTPPMKAGDKIIFEYSNGIRGVLANLVSLTTALLLIFYLIRGKRIIKLVVKVFGASHRRITTRTIKLIKWEEEE